MMRINRSILLVFSVVLFVVINSYAQVGQNHDTCVKLWGTPSSGNIDNKGFGTLIFMKSDISVELNFVRGRVQRAVYRKTGFDDKTIADILKLNGEGREWDRFVQAGRKPAENDPKQWMRRDEGVMAVLSSGKMEVINSGWYQYLAGPSPKNKLNKQQKVRVIKDKEIAPDPVRDIAGVWQCKSTVHNPIILNITKNGTLSWIVYGKKQQYKVRFKWKKDIAQEKEYIFTDTESLEDIATVELVSPENMEFNIKSGFKENRIIYQEAGMSTNMVFDRIKSMPRWKPDVPKNRPVKGDSRADVIRLLGKPTGDMMTGSDEIIIYPWGNVWLKNGVVDKID